MTGWKASLAVLIGITALALSSALFFAHPDRARAASLPSRLHHARHELRLARQRLRHDKLAYAAALAAQSAPSVDVTPAATPSATPTASDSPVPSDSPTPSDSPAPNATPSPDPSATAAPAAAPSLAQLLLAVKRDKRSVRRLAALVHRLHYEAELRRAAARGNWMPMVRDAARRSHIDAVGLRRLMSLESGGRAHAENGPYHGLYQYCLSTWHSAWNPWRHCSVYDGEAQIRATALAIHRGWGRSMWPNTYPRAF